jgi:hypothetical protein
MLEMFAFTMSGLAVYSWLTMVPGAVMSTVEASAAAGVPGFGLRVSIAVLAIGVVVPAAAIVLAGMVWPALVLALSYICSVGALVGASLWCGRVVVLGLPHLSPRIEWPLIDAALCYLPFDPPLVERFQSAYRTRHTWVTNTHPGRDSYAHPL